jgi:hypothetical protein
VPLSVSSVLQTIPIVCNAVQLLVCVVRE